MTCPKCQGPTARSDRLASGLVVLRCPRCDIYSIEDSGAWISSGADVVGRLHDLAVPLMWRREEIGAQMHAIMTAEDDDVRWDRF